LPTGLIFNAGGSVSGTPTVSGQFPITTTVTGSGVSSSRNALLTVADYTAASIVNTSLTTGAINAPYVDVLTAYGDAPITWTVSGTLPTGISFDTTNGFLTGVPTASFSGSLTFTATTVAGLTDSKTFTLTISGTNTGTGFTTRPYAFQADKARLVDIRDNATAGTFQTWLGDSAYTVPAPFFSAIAADAARPRVIPTGPYGISPYAAPNYSQFESWQVAFAGWLLIQPGANQNVSLGNTYRNQAVTELLDFLSRNGDGYFAAAYAPPGYSGTFILDTQGSLAIDPQNVAYLVGGIYDLCYDLLTTGQRTQCINFLKNFAYTIEAYSNKYWPVLYDPNHKAESHNNYWSSQTKALAIICIVTKGDLGTSDYNTILNYYLTRQSWYQNQYRLPKWQGVQSTESFWYSPVNIHHFEGTKLFDNAYGSNFSANKQWTFDSYIKYWLLGVNPAITRYMRQGDTPTVYGSKFQPIGATTWKALMIAANNAETASLGQIARKFVVDTFAARTAADPMGTPWYGTGYDGVKVRWSLTSSSVFDQYFYRDTAFTTSPISNFTDKYYAQPLPGGGTTLMRSAGTYAIGGTGRSAIIQNHQWDTLNAQPAWSHATADAGSFLWYQADDEVVLSPNDFSYSGILGALSYGLPYTDWFNLVTIDSESGYTYDGEPPWAADPAETYYVSKRLNGSGNNPRYINRVDGSAAAVPYYFQSLDLTKYFLNATLYTRQFVWLDDLQVLVLHDQVNTALSDPKTWRMHVYGSPAIAGSTVTTTTRGGSALVIRDLTSNGTFTSLNLYKYYDPNTEGQTPTRYNSQALINNFLNGYAAVGSRYYETRYPVYRITQPYSGNNLYSCKVLSINGRCTAASQSAISGGTRVTVTINGESRTVDIFDNGSPPTVSAASALDTGVRYIGNQPGVTSGYFSGGVAMPTSMQTAVSTQIISQSVTLAGLQATAYTPALTYVSTAYGSFELSVNGGAFATGEQAVSNGDTLRVRLTTSATYAAVGTATISFRTVSGGTDNYLLSFSYQNVNNDRAPQTFQVGSGRSYTQLYSVLPLLRAGDTVEIDSGTYGPTAYNGTMNALNQTIEYTLAGENTLGFSIISQSGVGTITFEKFVGGSWSALTVSGATTSTTFVSTGTYICRAGLISTDSTNYSGATKIRMRLSSYTSGAFKAAINFQYSALGAHTLTRSGTQALPITIKAAPGAATRPIITNGSLSDGTPGSYWYGLWVRAGSDVNFQGLEIVTDKCSSGVVTGSSTLSCSHRVTFTDCVMRDNSDGILGFDTGSGSTTLDRCWINNNGDGVYPTYKAHGAYFGGNPDAFPDMVITVKNCVFTNNESNSIKCRSPAKIYDNWIAVPNNVNSNYCIELPGLQGPNTESAHQNYADVCGNVLISQTANFLRVGGDGASVRTNAKIRYFKNTCVITGSYYNAINLSDAMYSLLFSSNAFIGANGNALSNMQLFAEQSAVTWTSGINLRAEYSNLPAGYIVSNNSSWAAAAQLASNTSGGTVANNTFASFDATPGGNLVGNGLTPPTSLPTNFALPAGTFRTDFSTRVWTTQPTLYSVLTVPSRASLTNIGAI
jgi:hypothetical protein